MQPIETELKKFLMELKNNKFKEIDFFENNFEIRKKDIKMCILSNLMGHIKNESSLALYDEDIFEIYKSIIENYKIFLEEYKKIEFKINDNMKKNINGLISVLNSQVSFFEEKDNFGINPILSEKRQIIANFLDKIYFYIENAFKYLKENIFKDIGQKENIKEIINSYLIENISKVYEENINNCFNKINDIENRKIIRYYIDILEEEREILSSIIRVQVKSIEDLCQNDAEINFTGNILNPIKEIYQFSTKRFNEYTENIKNINPNIKIDLKKDMENIEFKIKNIFDIEFNQYTENNLYEKLNNLIFNYFATIRNQKELELKNVFENFKQAENIFNSVQKKFIDINKFIEKNFEYYKKTDFKGIISGIFESIDIKIQILSENRPILNDLFLNLNNGLKDLEKFNINLEDYNLNEIFDNILNLEENEAKKYLEINLIERVFKNYQNLIEKIDKAIYNFKKDTLLFEISTFEEIINYSVVRLRKENNNSIKKFVFEIDNLKKDIKEILESNYIFYINPEPHTIFNAKEHEILMAEKSEQFKKGEIIKVLNCGYKTLDKVLIRANVIAAK